MTGKPIDAEDIAVLLRLQAALPDVGLNGWFEGVQVLARVIEHLTAAQQGQAAELAPPSAPVGVEAVRGAWLAAITLANNICVQESDRENDRDGDTGWIDGTAECAKRIREYAHPTDAELLEMLDEAGANAAKAALAQQPAAADMPAIWHRLGWAETAVPDDWRVLVREARESIETLWKAQQPTAVDEAMELVRDIAEQKPEKPDYWSSCGQCESNIGRAQEVLAAQHQEPKS